MKFDTLSLRLAEAQGRKVEFYRHRIEDVFAPQEYLDLSRALVQSDAKNAQALKHTDVARDLARQKDVQQFVWQEVSEGVNFYGSGSERRRKHLLICFAGGKLRMMMPTPSFLQRIDADLFDVVILSDRTRNHFRRGCPGFGVSFLTLVEAIDKTFNPKDYLSVKTIGASTGGLSAIRYGIIAQCERSISVGGLPPNDVRRMFSLPMAPPSFDPLCDCLAPKAQNPIFVYAELKTTDQKWACNYASMVNGTTVRINGLRTHGVFTQLWKLDDLDPFMNWLLGPELSELNQAKGKGRVYSVAVATRWQSLCLLIAGNIRRPWVIFRLLRRRDGSFPGGRHVRPASRMLKFNRRGVGRFVSRAVRF